VLREVIAQSQVGAGPDPEVAPVAVALVGEPDTGEHRERARPPVRLARRDAVDVRAAGAVRKRRRGQRDLGELGLLHAQPAPEQPPGRLGDPGAAIEIQQRMARGAEAGPEEVRPGRRLRIEQARDDRPAGRDLGRAEDAGHHHVPKPFEGFQHFPRHRFSGSDGAPANNRYSVRKRGMRPRG
jgi:hypothetical protein